jgi:hypothetical protein
LVFVSRTVVVASFVSVRQLSAPGPPPPPPPPPPACPRPPARASRNSTLEFYTTPSPPPPPIAAIVAVIAASVAATIAGVGEEILGKQRADFTAGWFLEIGKTLISTRRRELSSTLAHVDDVRRPAEEIVLHAFAEDIESEGRIADGLDLRDVYRHSPEALISQI